jgi:hypothetical protein
MSAEWDEKQQLHDLLMRMYCFHGVDAKHLARDKQGPARFDHKPEGSPYLWSEVQKHFNLSRDVCFAHAKANLETMCAMGFCCWGGSDGSHFHSLGHGMYESYYSDRGHVDHMEKMPADQAADMLLASLCKLGRVAFKPSDVIAESSLRNVDGGYAAAGDQAQPPPSSSSDHTPPATTTFSLEALQARSADTAGCDKTRLHEYAPPPPTQQRQHFMYKTWLCQGTFPMLISRKRSE